MRRLIRLLFVPLLKPADRILQLLLPVSARRFFYFSHPDYSDSAYYLYRHIVRTRNACEHVWMVKDPGLEPRIRCEFAELVRLSGNIGHTLRVVRTRSVRGYLLHLMSRYVFHTHGIIATSNWAPKRDVVCLWHGMPIKCIGRLNRISPSTFPTFGTTHLATSHLFKYMIACAFGTAPESVKVCGLPRCDALTYEDARCHTGADIRRLLDIPANTSILLWMPTYRSERVQGELRSFGRSFLDELPDGMLQALEDHCERHDCVIVAKLHPKDPFNHAARPLDSSRIRLLTSTQWLTYGIQLYDLLAASSALLSDVSSVVIDYMVTGRPIGFIGFDADSYLRDLTMPLDLVLRSSAVHALSDATDVAHFFDELSDNGIRSRPRSDLSWALYENFSLPSSENVLRALDL